MRPFEEDQQQEILSYQPEILAATVPVLLRLAGLIRVARAIVAFSGPRVGPVSALDRDLLWRAYHIPLFEQRLGPDGGVIARECEAHDGLHLYVPQAYHGLVRREPCPCGRVEPRIG